MNRGASGWRARRLPRRHLAPSLRPWLDEPGSLTRRVRRSCSGCFHIEVLRECWGPPFSDEALRLDLRLGRWVWLREVLLCCGDGAWIYARSAIPRRSLRGPLRRLRQLGRQPLGSVLFGRHPVRRGKIEIARLTPSDGLYRRAVRRTMVTPGCWARRSVFHIAGRPLLVSEVFLPELVALIDGGELP